MNGVTTLQAKETAFAKPSPGSKKELDFFEEVKEGQGSYSTETQSGRKGYEDWANRKTALLSEGLTCGGFSHCEGLCSAQYTCQLMYLIFTEVRPKQMKSTIG